MFAQNPNKRDTKPITFKFITDIFKHLSSGKYSNKSIQIFKSRVKSTIQKIRPIVKSNNFLIFENIIILTNSIILIMNQKGNDNLLFSSSCYSNIYHIFTRKIGHIRVE
ncbi:hypothetical protein MXB_993 [Myxobolus squamalis]|nr:hypothetical protein MXB_993 [Myxobolus squamalis]